MCFAPERGGRKRASIYAVLDVEDSSYTKITYRDGTISDIDAGTWEIDGRDLICHPSSNLYQTRYEVRGGSLYNGDHKFTRQ